MIDVGVMLSEEQQYLARRMNEGEIIYSSLTEEGLRIHTEHGSQPYVWRHTRWIPTND